MAKLALLYMAYGMWRDHCLSWDIANMYIPEPHMLIRAEFEVYFYMLLNSLLHIWTLNSSPYTVRYHCKFLEMYILLVYECQYYKEQVSVGLFVRHIHCPERSIA